MFAPPSRAVLLASRYAPNARILPLVGMLYPTASHQSAKKRRCAVVTCLLWLWNAWRIAPPLTSTVTSGASGSLALRMSQRSVWPLAYLSMNPATQLC